MINVNVILHVALQMTILYRLNYKSDIIVSLYFTYRKLQGVIDQLIMW